MNGWRRLVVVKGVWVRYLDYASVLRVFLGVEVLDLRVWALELG
jgi:hypothetical protein